MIVMFGAITINLMKNCNICSFENLNETREIMRQMGHTCIWESDEIFHEQNHELNIKNCLECKTPTITKASESYKLKYIKI